MRYPEFVLALSVVAGLQLNFALAGASTGCTEIRVAGVSVCTGSVTGISEDADIEGVSIINGKVFIDGAPVPRGASRVTSKKTGKTYRVKTDKSGNVSVEEQLKI
jgi:hypothetical protein